MTEGEQRSGSLCNVLRAVAFVGRCQVGRSDQEEHQEGKFQGEEGT